MSEREPSADELLAMAYADGELAQAVRVSFEARLAREPALRAQVAELRRLEVLAREFAPPEPLELAVAAIERSTADRWTRRVGWALVGIGTLVGLYFLVAACAELDVPWPLKFAVGAIVLGSTLLVLRTARLRARTRHLDPYRSVKR